MKLQSFNKCLWIFFYLSCTGAVLEAQPLKTSSGLVVKSWVDKEKVQLRWAPSTATLWEYGNKYGYLVERYSIEKNGSAVPLLLTDEPLKPLPESEWAKLYQKNTLAAVGAHVIFAIDHQPAGINLVNNFISQSLKQEQKFMLGMMVANQDTALAKASGLYFSDRILEGNKKYLYKIYIDLPPAFAVKSDTGYVLADPNKESQLVAPAGLTAKWEDHLVELRWPQKIYQDVYESYWLEKSIDGINFTALTELPLINLQTSEDQEYQIWTDTLDNNHETCFYRLRGKDWFGNLSPYGRIISGKGRIPLNIQPVIFSGSPTSNGIQLKWRFENYTPTQKLKYQLIRCHKPGDQFKIMSEGWIYADSSSFIDKQPDHENYYQVNVIKDDQIRQSTPWQVMLPDTIPPAAPKKLEGLIDTLGIVTLKWQESDASDLEGYLVYRGDHLKSEYSLVSRRMVKHPFFSDTINLNNLDTAIHYKILALDRYFNRSPFSKPVSIKKPDMIPPQPPVISSISNEKYGIKVSWESQKDEVAQYFLFRRTPDHQWQCIHQDAPGPYYYLDTGVVAEQEYEYTVISRDKVGNDSQPAISKIIKRVGINHGYALLKASGNKKNGGISLSWNQSKELNSVRIFRAVADEPLRAYRTIENKNNQYSDTNVKHNQRYSYRIQFIWVNGSTSLLSNEVHLKYR